MEQNELKEYLSQIGWGGAILFENPSYDTACIGVTEDGRTVYDYKKMVEHLIEFEEMEYDEAVDFISYNTIRALPYIQDHPIIVNLFE